jgi:hypothetical protein
VLVISSVWFNVRHQNSEAHLVGGGFGPHHVFRIAFFTGNLGLVVHRIIERTGRANHVTLFDFDWVFKPVIALPVKVPFRNVQQGFCTVRPGIQFYFDAFRKQVHVSTNRVQGHVVGVLLIAGGDDVAGVANRFLVLICGFATDLQQAVWQHPTGEFSGSGDIFAQRTFAGASLVFERIRATDFDRRDPQLRNDRCQLRPFGRDAELDF